MIEDIVVTNITARLIAKAGLVSLEMAINEQRPRNLERITLLMNTAEMNMAKNCPAFTQPLLGLNF